MFWIAGGNHHNLCSSFDFVFNCSSRIELETEDLRNFFNDPKTPNPFPDFDCLLGRAGMLVDKYATQSAIQASLTLKDSTDRKRKNQVQVGSAWTADTTATTDDSEPPGLSEIEEPDTPRNMSVPLPSKAPDDAPRVHEEKKALPAIEYFAIAKFSCRTSAGGSNLLIPFLKETLVERSKL
jgi:hypothetical protein